MTNGRVEMKNKLTLNMIVSNIDQAPLYISFIKRFNYL